VGSIATTPDHPLRAERLNLSEDYAMFYGLAAYHIAKEIGKLVDEELKAHEEPEAITSPARKTTPIVVNHARQSNAPCIDGKPLVCVPARWADT
jgi:hypothetical protein